MVHATTQEGSSSLFGSRCMKVHGGRHFCHRKRRQSLSTTIMAGLDIISSRVSSSKVVAPQGTVQITVKSSVFASAFSNTLLFWLGQVDTLDPRAGQKCGKYSNRSNRSDTVCQVRASPPVGVILGRYFLSTVLRSLCWTFPICPITSQIPIRCTIIGLKKGADLCAIECFTISTWYNCRISFFCRCPQLMT
jgi:hypothetical protein